jgi:hypothetical protein
VAIVHGTHSLSLLRSGLSVVYPCKALAETSPPDKDRSKDQFFYPTSRYYGEFTPTNLAFNANLQEFAQRVSIICNLETGGKISSQEAYQQIKELWHKLKTSKNELLDQPQPPKPDLPEV